MSKNCAKISLLVYEIPHVLGIQCICFGKDVHVIDWTESSLSTVRWFFSGDYDDDDNDDDGWW